MDTIRQQKVANLLQKEFASMLNNELKPYLHGAFVTLTYVKVTPDLSLARFNLSVMNSEDKQRVIHELKQNKSEIRGILGRKVSNLRKIPNIDFFLDDTLDYVDKMETLFDSLKNKEDIE